ncbi:replication initiator [Streptomyces stelliscabiei]|uniref:replication initiator n=1 Tax=Streptomyces stelliscabiei TaxID=146820 RepID=UPI002FF04B60
MPSHDRTTAIPRPEPAAADLAVFASYRNLPGLVRQLSSLGGCAQPIRLEGHRTEINAATGEILRELKSKNLPAGHLLVRCGNRRTTRCPSCAELYRQDTFHLMAAGLRGGKNIPEQVAAHPRVFATLTAPSYGPVHGRRSSSTARCGCGRTHAKDDPAPGTPLNPDRYDYTGAVLWNAHAPALWARFMLHLRRTIAAVAGIPQRLLSKFVRVSYAKVAEYQRRGLIHFHAVIRLDGPANGHTPPPAWATPEMLTDAVRTAVARAHVDGPEIDGHAYAFTFGKELDVKVIRSAAFQNGATITEGKVAGYVAKYATKGAESATGTLDHRLKLIAELGQETIPDHAARMIRTAWALGALRDLEHLKLRAWAHMLGFRGHFSTKTRTYSTTLGTLREARAAWHRRHTPEPGLTTLVLAHWAFDGVGLTPDLERLAVLIGGSPAREQTVTADA